MSEKQIYLMEHEFGPVKIGRSGDSEKRLDRIKYFSPYEIRLRTTLTPINDVDRVGVSVENGLHDYYRRYWRQGEWYDLPQKEVEALDGIDRIAASELLTVRHELGNYAHSDDGEYTIADHLRDAWVYNQQYENEEVAK